MRCRHIYLALNRRSTQQRLKRPAQGGFIGRAEPFAVVATQPAVRRRLWIDTVVGVQFELLEQLALGGRERSGLPDLVGLSAVYADLQLGQSGLQFSIASLLEGASALLADCDRGDQERQRLNGRGPGV